MKYLNDNNTFVNSWGASKRTKRISLSLIHSIYSKTFHGEFPMARDTLLIPIDNFVFYIRNTHQNFVLAQK